MIRTLPFLALLAACGEKDGTPVDSDPTPVVTDNDGDGYDGVDHGGDDCDDSDAAIHPGQDEVCDGIDNNCDGTVDTDAIDLLTFYQDRDGDGIGGPQYTERACEPSSGYVERSDDCDDRDATAYPGAPELCDDVDNNCNGNIDELGAVDAPSWYPDNDGDGYGDPDYAYVACAPPSGPYIAQGEDCDDARAAVNPGAEEICDGLDNNCDGDVDGADATGAPTWYYDADGDGYGDANTTEGGCEAPSGYIEDDSDCDDASADISPDATEVCDGVDNDCDGDTDEPDAADAATWYQDFDGDGYGDASVSTDACDQPSGYVSDDSDCDDSTTGIYPGAPEYCDGTDSDCDGTLDEGDAVDASTWYADTDGDGYGDASATTSSCDQPSGYVSDATDCDDSANSSNPAADEICYDSADNDCDGTLDECAPEGTLSLDDAFAVIYGAANGDRAGDDIADGGDINGDGNPDLLIGAPYDDDGGSNGGAVHVVYGPLTADVTLGSGSSYALSSVEGSGHLGDAVAGVGDVNNDGYDDFIAGAPGHDLDDEDTSLSGYTNSGAAYLFLGPISADDNTVSYYSSNIAWHGYGEDGGWAFGTAVTGLGDQNGDGYDDFAISAPGHDTGTAVTGVVYVYNGPLSSGASFDYVNAVATVLGEADGDEAGSAIASADVNGDGVQDLLTGARYYGNDVGRAYVSYGPLTGTVDLGATDVELLGVDREDAAGQGMAGGDLDGDGYADMLIGAPFEDGNGTDAGGVYLVYGGASVNASINLNQSNALFTGAQADDQIGYSIDGSHDYDGDGNLDLMLGSSRDAGSASFAGATYLLYGPPGSGSISVGTFDATFQGGAAQDRSGWQVTGLDDHDGDGYDDLFISAPYEDTTDSNAGAAYLWLGDVR
ncbi:MAG: FG-GAP repeat protein [Alphaproteobacteria bacterium]|nr:FG-GAP repeat protein [Alphaproteobacteria bacterium]